MAGGGRIEARQDGQAALADVVWFSEALDLAVLRLRGDGLRGLRPLPLAVSPPAPLLDVIAVGFPGAANAVTAASAPSYNEGNVGRVVEGTWGIGAVAHRPAQRRTLCRASAAAKGTTRRITAWPAR